MNFKSELLFIDPSVPDINIIVKGLRPEVDAVLLTAERPVASQMAAHLAGREDLDVIHIMAHGSPGRVHFAAGDWSLETLARQESGLRQIGQALGEGAELRLWSCEVGKGEEGAAFTAALSRLVGAPVASAEGRVGHAVRALASFGGAAAAAAEISMMEASSSETTPAMGTTLNTP